MVAAWWSYCSSSGSTSTPVRARGMYTQACAVTHIGIVYIYIYIYIHAYSHRYVSFTTEKLARVRYICLSSGFLLHLSPLRIWCLMLFFRSRLSHLSLTPVSLQRYCLCSISDWGLEALRDDWHAKTTCWLSYICCTQVSVNGLCNVSRL